MKHPFRRLLIGLAFLLLLIGFITGKADRHGRLPLWIRMLSTGLISLAALLQTHDQRRVSQSAAIAMLAGFIGDLCMAHIIPLPEPVLGGMLSFGIGHGFYLQAFQRLAREQQLISAKTHWSGVITGWLIAALGWRLMVYSSATNPPLNQAALGYSLLLGSMAGSATGLALQKGQLAPLAVGGWLFLLSDLILASRIFRQQSFLAIDDLIWLTYISGQALLVDTLAATAQAV